METKYIYEASVEDDAIAVHAEKCGQHFPYVLVVKDVSSLNPLIQITKPLGIGAVKKILNHLYKEYGVMV